MTRYTLKELTIKDLSDIVDEHSIKGGVDSLFVTGYYVVDVSCTFIRMLVESKQSQYFTTNLGYYVTLFVEPELDELDIDIY